MPNWIKMILTGLLLSSFTFAQLLFKRDDFNAASPKDWWQYDVEGTAIQGIYGDGVLKLGMPEADNTEPWCNTSIWDGHNMYGDVTVTIRARGLTSPRPGSRGWGLWYTTALSALSENAWFMQVGDSSIYSNYDPQNLWWKAQITDMYQMGMGTWNTEVDLSEDITEWHTYKIVREIGAASEFTMYIDGSLILTAPDIDISHDLSVQIWNDNLVYFYDPLGYENRVWSAAAGADEFVIDYVEILTDSHPGTSETPSGSMLLREIPFEFGDGSTLQLWKTYNFTAPNGPCVILVTARAEFYDTYGDDDDVKIVVNGHDYDWNSSKSFDGNLLQGASKTVVIDTVFSAGPKTIQIYGDQSPVLYDVTVLGSANGQVILNDEVEETAAGGANQLWKTYNFNCAAGEVAIYISGTADEDNSYTNHGQFYSNFNNADDDDIRVELDGNDYGLNTDNSLWGNRLFGESKSILIRENLTAGAHTLNIYSYNTPRLHNVLIFGENSDNPLPVSLSSYYAEQIDNRIEVYWQTQSEINNLGFYIYRAITSNTEFPDTASFKKLNNQIIQGAGNTSALTSYSFTDLDMHPGQKHWYYLEDVSYDGKAEKHSWFNINVEKTPDKFKLYQNYPNPFNSETTISFALAERQRTKVDIYDFTGRHIKTLFNDYLSNGLHYFKWDGTNQENISVGSGVFICQITTPNTSKAIKLAMIK